MRFFFIYFCPGWGYRKQSLLAGGVGGLDLAGNGIELRAALASDEAAPVVR